MTYQLQKTNDAQAQAHDQQHDQQHETRTPRLRQFTRFDLSVVVAISLLVGAILVTIVLGDRVGVTLVRVSPLGEAHSTSRIVVEFSEQMDRESVAERFRLAPEVPGAISWSNRTLSYRPDAALTPGTDYTVILEAGAVSVGGREVLSEYQFGFTVLLPRVAYLYPSDSAPSNLWIADPTDPHSAEQLTFSTGGIYDFAVNPDGTQIAYAQNRTDSQSTDLYLLDLETGTVQQLTNCIDSQCTTPVWRPDGRTIAYERIDFNTGVGGVGPSPPRIWLLDLTSVPATTRPLFAESQILGYNAQWSADGSRIALFDSASSAILVYDFPTDQILAVSSRAGSSGALSPDGTRLVYPDITLLDDLPPWPHLRVVDLESEEQTNLSEPGGVIEDGRALWRPDGEMLAVARRYHDATGTRGYQIVLVDPSEGGETQTVTSDPRYANNFFWWDPTGTQLVIQRFPELDENMQPNRLGRPEIWTVDVTTGEGTQVAVNGFLPRWVP
ncbi:MAG: hypothetical protein GYB67_15055 [Chloroflexi bacterium]|nr:hypothetical protein [Chloroflexota bacterium]